MKIMVEAGHGKDYRQRGQYDFGLFSDDGSQEPAIAIAYAGRLRAALKQHGHLPEVSSVGSIASRLRHTFRRGKEIIVSLHMGHDVDALPGGRVLWATEGSKPIAEAVAQALGFPSVQTVQETGLLRFNPSLEIELGNITSWSDMKRLRCAAHCSEMCSKIARALPQSLGEE